MGLSKIVRSRGFRNFMSKLYGWGAAIVILGALFKINHYDGANTMLIIGLGTEAIIFFFSAFEPPYVEPDWSLVYPQLAVSYHGKPAPVEQTGVKSSKGVAKELDKLLEDAKIDSALLQSLGEGMRKLSENTARLSNMSSAAVASDEFINSMKSAANSVEKLAQSSAKSSELLEKDAAVTETYIKSVQSASENLNTLGIIYNQAGVAIKNDLEATTEFSKAVKNASQSASELAQRYSQSAEFIAKAAEKVDLSTIDSESYGSQLKKVSSNLSALNTAYEMQLASLQEQLETSKKLQASVNQFLGNVAQTAEDMNRYRQEVDALTRKIAALNNVYGNMLSAMNVNIK